MKTYREQIIETIKSLSNTREIIFEQIVNLAMSNEYGYIQKVFEEGDVYSFSLSHFENMEDANIQNLVSLCKKTEEAFYSIINLNGIKEEEIE